MRASLPTYALMQRIAEGTGATTGRLMQSPGRSSPMRREIGCGVIDFLNLNF
jgi:hypothetical protein